MSHKGEFEDVVRALRVLAICLLELEVFGEGEGLGVEGEDAARNHVVAGSGELLVESEAKS